MAATNLTISIEKAFPGPDGEISYDSTNDLYMDPNEPGMQVLYRVSGHLKSAGVGVSGKKITVTYNGSTFGSDYTNASGYYEVTDGIQNTPMGYKMYADFAGTPAYLASSKNKNFTLFLIPVTLTGVNIPASFPEDQYLVVKGTVNVNWADWFYDGSPVENASVNLDVSGTTENSAYTDSNGNFKLYHTFPNSTTASIVVEVVAGVVYDGAIDSGSVTIKDHWYPQPEDVETDCYAWVICIDPNAIRAGPMYYILDEAQVKPGLTDTVGTFAGQLNDNRKVRPADGFIQYDLYLLGEDKLFILDQDEYWIGLQRGVASKRYDPENYSWSPTGGVDGKGSGIKWLMGGYISKRYYTRTAKGRDNAIILGKCYMDVWKDQKFGTDEIPREYTEPTSLDVIANDLFADVNAQQLTDYKYTTHPTYWQSPTTTLTINVRYADSLLTVVDASIFSVGQIIRISDATGLEDLQITSITDTIYLQQLNIQSYPTVDPINPGIQNILGYDKETSTISSRNGLMSITWQQDFVDDNPFDIMQEMCEEAIYEWRINYLKQVMFYSKGNPPKATDRDIRYNSNIRAVPEIVMGDTENIITDVVVRDGFPTTYPENIDLWSSVPGAWYEIGNSGIRVYASIFTPAPPNPVTEAYTDSSLIFDDDNRPALCFQHEGTVPGPLDLLLHYAYRLEDDVLGSGATIVSANMNLDLRTYRRIKFKWRHVTWNGVTPDYTGGDTANIYAIELHTTLNDAFIFYFGEGTQETLGHSHNDLIEASPSTVGVPQDTDWKLIDLLLPEPEANGDISYISASQMKGWDVVGNPDPTDVNWVAFYVRLPEVTPNSGYARVSGYKILVTISPGAGDNHIQVNAPENLAGFQTGAQTYELILNRPIDAEIDGEGVQLRVLYPRTAPATENIRLEAPLISGKSTGDPLRVLAGKTFCFSQLRFERDFKGIGTGISTLGPKRYRVYREEEFKFQSQADSKVDAILNMEGVPRRWVKIEIDGDPEKEVGTSVKLYLDPSHNTVFENVRMMIDDIQYVLNAVNLVLELTLSPLTLSPKTREVNEFNVSDRSNLEIRRKDNRGKRNFIERGVR